MYPLNFTTVLKIFEYLQIIIDITKILFNSNVQILQFLVDHDFENTADALMVEATIKGFKHCKKDLQVESDIYENCYEQLMFSYKTGDWRTFFNV